eukprot:scaffold9736_cov144-Skeletonema_marinoi.AAC.24
MDDDNTDEHLRSPSPLTNASIISKVFFIWPSALMVKKAKLTSEESLPDVIEADTATFNLRTFQEMWDSEKERAGEVMKKYHLDANISSIIRPSSPPKEAYPNLFRAIVKHFMSRLCFVQLCMFISSVGKLVQAYALGCLLQSIETRDGNSIRWAGLLSLSGIVSITSLHHAFFFAWHKGMQYRISAVAAIHEKALRLKSNDSSSAGHVVNLASNDCERFLLATAFGSYIIWAPLLSIVILVLGCVGIGWSFVAGFGLLVFLFIPMQLFLSKKFSTLRSSISMITDKRVTLTSQAASGVRVMKMQGWENNFEDRIAAIRAKETDQIQLVNWYRARNEALFFVANIVSAAVIFAVHVGSGGTLTSRNVFSTLVLLNLAQIELTKCLSLGVMGVTEAKVSVGRIQRFLQTPEHRIEVRPINASTPCSTTVITLSNVTCHWNYDGNGLLVEKELQSFSDSTDGAHGDPEKVDYYPHLIMALDNINANFAEGQLTCILGQVGSGKSALLQLLAGELALSNGSHYRKAGYSIAYAQQDPWIMDGNVKDNILMGRPFDGELYERVVLACGLNVDFLQMPHHDETFVGECGSQLSGGQRARVALARALYRDSDIVLLDDPLAAVDAKVGRHLFEAAIKNLVERGKCVVLVTHQHHFAVNERCILMNTGHIECTGSYQECVAASGGRLSLTSSANDCPKEHEELSKASTDHGVGLTNNPATPPVSSSTAIKKKQDTEVSTSGVVKMNTFKSYIKAMPGGPLAGLALLLVFCVTQASALACITFIGKWANLPADDQWSISIIASVFGLCLAAGGFALIRAIMYFHLTIEASKRLHNDMAKSVLRAKLEFFDTNSLGRVLNRFSAEVGIADDQLPVALFDFSVILFMTIGALVSALFILPLTAIFLPPLVWYFLRVRGIFLKTSRELKRIEGMARSPIFNCLSESLSGIATIRSNGAIEYFQKKFSKLHDAHSRSFFAFIACERWLGFRMDTIMAVFTAIVSFAAVIMNDKELIRIDPGVLGLTLSLLLQLSMLFQYMIRQSAQVINNMISVERIQNFCDLPSEAAFTNEYDNQVSPNWPQSGSIEIQDLSVRYRDGLPLSLRNLSFKIDGGSRVGIVGRTGCGKSTLLQSLLRLLEAESGQIVVDGIDISKIGLRKLRSSISVIPQTPVLFGGGCTLRENLDPFQTVPDEFIYEALLQ